MKSLLRKCDFRRTSVNLVYIVSTFRHYQLSQLTDLRRRISESLSARASLQEAAQTFVDSLYPQFEESTVLVRVFSTMAFRELPKREKDSVRNLAASRNCESELEEETTVVSLLGTRGKKPNWNDRYLSKKRLAIPLLRPSFIKTIPVVSVLSAHSVTGVGWIEKQRAKILVTTVGQMARMVFVDDAATSLTNEGFKTVPAQNFVWDHEVKTVIGLGGAYLSGAFVSIMIFTNETIAVELVKKFMPLVNTFKTATTGLVMNGKLFS